MGRRRGLRSWLAPLLVLVLVAAACGGGGAASRAEEPLVISALPDQDPHLLQRLYRSVSGYLEDKLGVPVEYQPVTDYTASVSLFKVGDLDLVWFGGLTGVQARLQVPGAQALVQRDIDTRFRSAFIVNSSTGLGPVTSVNGLRKLEGLRFTFGSETSTSGRLMPQYFLNEAGVEPNDFVDEVGFSGDHDKTIKLVESGSYQAGALNAQVWDARVKEGLVDSDKVLEFFRTPSYYDYHWVIHPGVEQRYGDDFIERVKKTFLELDGSTAQEKKILRLFSAGKFIETENSNYLEIEQTARGAGLIK